MPLTFRSISGATEVASGNLTLTEPAGAASGDLLVASISYRSNAAFTLPSGWSLVDEENTGNTTANSTASIGSGLMAYIVRGGSAPDLAFLRTGGDVALGRIAAYTPGAGETVTLDQSSGNTLGAASTTVTTTGVTTTEDLALIVMAECLARNTTASRARATDPDEFVWRERADSATATGADVGLAVSDATRLADGATGTLTYTAGASARHVCIVGAFKTGYAGPTPHLLALTEKAASTTNLTTSSFTPTADALLIVSAAIDIQSGTGLASCAITDTASLSWTQIEFTNDVYESGTFNQTVVSWWAVAPSSPSSMTVTIDPAGTVTHPAICHVYEVIGADTASPIGGKIENAHFTDTQTLTLDATPASDSLILFARSAYDITGEPNARHALALDAWIPGADRSDAADDLNFSTAWRVGGTSTSVGWADAYVGGTVSAEDACVGHAFEIKADAGGALTLTQGARLDNANDLFAAVVRADWNVAQAARLDNANTLNAHRVDLTLLEAARLDNANVLGAHRLDLTIVEGLRLDNVSVMNAHVVTAAALLTQGARLDNANVLGAHRVDLTLLEAARLDNASTLNAHRLDLTIVQGARLDDGDTLFAAVVSAAGDQTLTQAVRLDNANVLNAHRLDLGLVEGARLDNAGQLFAARIDLALTLGLRLDNANALNAHRVDLTLVAPARLENANTLGAHVVASGLQLTQGARLENASTLFAATVAANWSLVQGARIDPANVLFAARIDQTVSQAARLDNANVLFAHVLHLSIAQPLRLDNLSTLFAAQILGGFGIGLDVAYETVRAWFESEWTATARRFENERLEPPADLAPFVFMEFETRFVDQSEFGSGDPDTNVWRAEGEAVFHVLVGSGTGAETVRGLAEDLAHMLKGLVLTNGVRLGALSIGAGEELVGDGNYFDLPVTAEWARENWKLGSD